MGAIALLSLGIVIYVILLVCVWAMQDRLMFGRRTNTMIERPSDRGWPYEDVWIDRPEGKTHGWWMPVDNARGTVLFSHGSGRNISGYLEDAALFREQGLSVLMYDYGGYGQSTGQPSEARCCADAQGMWNELVQIRKIPAERIVVAGASMGGGVTGDLASHVSPAGVILESTFTSIPDTLWDTYPFIPTSWLCHIQFRNIDKVGLYKCPVLIVHSKDDTVVPFAHGQRLMERITAPKMFVEIRGAHYGGKFTSKETYSAALSTFLKDYTHL
jgi:alpha-beta hydrolase superfamily lysophospholipase